MKRRMQRRSHLSGRRVRLRPRHRRRRERRNTKAEGTQRDRAGAVPRPDGVSRAAKDNWGGEWELSPRRPESRSARGVSLHLKNKGLRKADDRLIPVYPGQNPGRGCARSGYTPLRFGQQPVPCGCIEASSTRRKSSWKLNRDRWNLKFRVASISGDERDRVPSSTGCRGGHRAARELRVEGKAPGHGLAPSNLGWTELDEGPLHACAGVAEDYVGHAAHAFDANEQSL